MKKEINKGVVEVVTSGAGLCIFRIFPKKQLNFLLKCYTLITVK
jgi:hypothetical protein